MFLNQSFFIFCHGCQNKFKLTLIRLCKTYTRLQLQTILAIGGLTDIITIKTTYSRV